MNKYKFVIEPIWNSDKVELLQAATLEGKLVYSKLAEQELNFRFVQKGAVLLSRVGDEEESVVLDQSKEISTNQVYEIGSIGKHINNMLGGKNYTAEFDGVFYIKDNQPNLISINNDAIYQLNVSDDKMELTMDLFPPAADGKKFLLTKIFNELMEFGIKAEINGQSIESGITSLEGKDFPLYGVKVANGFKPIDGIDGKLEYFVNTKVDFSPKIGDDGRVDFYNLNIINSVDKDQNLVLFHPHVAEQDGRNIFGDTIPARKARVVKFPQGKNTYPDPANPNLLKASCDGIIVDRDGVISVSEIYRINGNVDYSTGNINNKGSVSVLGDVKSGFCMEVNDAVDVKGLVEDCIIKAGADVRVKSGFSGKGKGVIFSQGNVDVRYVRNQRIHSRKSISVSNEVLDSELFAALRIQVAGGKNMSILGGHTIAGQTIEVNCLGNEYGIKTLIEAGYDYNLINQIRKNKEQITQLETTLLNVEEGLNNFLSRIRLAVDLKKTLSLLMEQKIVLFENQEKYDDFEERKKKLNFGIEKILKSSRIDQNCLSNITTLFDQKIIIRKKIKNLETDIRNTDKIIHTPTKSKIKVNRIAYPGTTIMINKIKYVVTEPILNKVFYIGKDGREISMA